METNNQSNRISSYLEYLPASQQADPFLGRFLLAFERILSGFSSTEPQDPFLKQQGLEEEINRIHTYFYPGTKEDSDTAQSEFLPWLAGWVALSLREEWTEEGSRQFIRQIVPLYRRRGTKAGLEKILELYLKSSNLPGKVQIFEFDNPPHYFQVQLTLAITDTDLYWRQKRIAKAIIDQEKPAHTYYVLKTQVQTMRLTGQFYSVHLKQKGKITASVEIETNDVLVLSIKGTQARAKLVKQNTGRKSVSVSHNVTQEFDANIPWQITVANLSDNIVTGKITITVYYEEETDSQTKGETQEFALPPGLKIGKHPNRNTFIGTDYVLKTQVQTMRLTGQFYSVHLKQKGKITASVEIETNDVLVLSIKGTQARAKIVKQNTGRKSVSVSHNVTQEEFDANIPWQITVANLSDNIVTGKITITVYYEEETDSQTKGETQEFALPPGLKIGKHPNGNALIGTEIGKN
ncbi:phage tail protein [Microcoleus sp. D3_18_C4]|uniref:phage tail protein n=1 Tax=Microcoleus sp. D3_18_C4 TaxID=3055335 RepID=UPI002FD20A9A